MAEGELSAVRALGAALRQHRMSKGMSLRALARNVGLSAHGTLVDYEHGRRIPPEDLLVACEKVLDLDDGTLRRLRLEALAERADAHATVLLAPSPSPVPVPARRPRWYLYAAVVVAVVAVVGGFVLWPDGGAPETGTLRFGFESPADNWTIFWGAQKAKAGVTTDRHYEGAHSFQVTMQGPSMKGPGKEYGYVGFGTTHGLETLHAGMRVTMHIWTSYLQDGFLFKVYEENSHDVNAPETPYDGSEVHADPGPDGWATMTWTVPNVPVVRAIIIQPYQRDDTPRLVAVDAVSW